MLNAIVIVARKELLDSWRDRRAMLSAALYCLMGPAVVWMVSLTVHNGQLVLSAMMAVFTLVSAFSGGMNVAMDSIAGERERRSLVPLLMHPVTRRHLLAGKWLAVALFAAAGLAINLAGFALIVHRVPPPSLALPLIPLALLAAALELWISTLCRGIKEAHTYLSMLVFLPMGIGMFMVFSPLAAHGWWTFLPVAGQQLQLAATMGGTPPDAAAMFLLGLTTATAAGLALLAAANRLECDDVVYGG
ncbi:MAG TPA: ABC transporter permease subunit [Bryobacteraceae bacterium]|jgi:sodium transport system permease protein|nr:ABC transporter permease subunit [Bryobacteraceae bacterium]